MNPEIDPVTGQPVQAVQPIAINRAGAPPRQMNNLQVNALDPNTSNFNNTQAGYASNMFSTPMMKTEGEVTMATDATKLKKGGDKYGEFKSMKMKRPDGVTVSADMSTATKDKLPELTVTAKLGDLNKDGKMSSWEQARQKAIDSNSPATRNDPPKSKKPGDHLKKEDDPKKIVKNI